MQEAKAVFVEEMKRGSGKRQADTFAWHEIVLTWRNHHNFLTRDIRMKNGLGAKSFHKLDLSRNAVIHSANGNMMRADAQGHPFSGCNVGSLERKIDFVTTVQYRYGLAL